MPNLTTAADRNAALTRLLASRALGMAVDAAPYRAAAGSTRYSMLHAAPAARVMLGADEPAARAAFVDELAALASAVQACDKPPALTDGQGHARPVYYPLCVHLMLSALALHKRAAQQRLGEAWADRLAPIMQPIRSARIDDNELDDAELATAQVNALLWHGLCELEWALLTDNAFEGALAMRLIERVQNLAGSDGASAGGALHAQAGDDTPDAWVYRELTGLHALHLASQVARHTGWAARCALATQYHLGHTQPDYTTYQPWALPAFAEHEATAVFAEQQLHDVQTHLAIEGPGGALLPALLLADASASLDGRIVGAWQRYRFQG